MIEFGLAIVSLMLFGFGVYYTLEAVRIRRRVMPKISQSEREGQSDLESIQLLEKFLPILLANARDKNLIRSDESEKILHTSKKFIPLMIQFDQAIQQEGLAYNDELEKILPLLDDYKWIMTEFNRTISLLNSENEAEVLTGSQILFALVLLCQLRE